MSVRIARTAEGWVATIAIRDRASGVARVRELPPARACADAVTSAALATALALDPIAIPDVAAHGDDTVRVVPRPSAAAGAPAPPAAGRREVATAPSTAVVVAVSRRPAATVERARVRPTLALGVSAGLLGNATPTLGIVANAGFAWGRFGGALEVRLDVLPLFERAASTPGVRYTTQTGWALLAACLRIPWVRACGLVGGGAMRLSASDGSEPRDAFVALVSFGVRGGLSWPERGPVRVALYGDLLAVAPAVQLALAAREAPVWQSPPVSIATALAVEWSPGS